MIQMLIIYPITFISVDILNVINILLSSHQFS